MAKSNQELRAMLTSLVQGLNTYVPGMPSPSRNPADALPAKVANLEAENIRLRRYIRDLASIVEQMLPEPDLTTSSVEETEDRG